MAKKNKGPKRIAGVKIPKSLRPTLRPVARFAESPLGREIIAEAVVAVSIALATSRPAKRAAGEVAQDAAAAGFRLASAFQNVAAAALAPVVRAAQARAGETGPQPQGETAPPSAADMPPADDSSDKRAEKEARRALQREQERLVAGEI